MARSSFGMTDGTFLFLVRFFLCVDKEKNEQASSLAKQIINDKIQYNTNPFPTTNLINFMNPQNNNSPTY